MNLSVLTRFVAAIVVASLALLWPGARVASAQDAFSDAEMGRKLWDSRRIVGARGETCASCHDSVGGAALDARSLREKRQRLRSIVFFELVTRSGNRMVQFDGSEVSALTAHLVERYRLDQELAEPLTAPDPDRIAREQLELASKYYSEGLLEPAITLLTGSLKKEISAPVAVEAHTLLGCIYHVLGRGPEVIEEFSAALRLDPQAEIDGETFSPTTVALFESVRRSLNSPR